MGNKYYIDAEEIAKALDVHPTTAYRIIKELNKQLKAQGFIVVASISTSIITVGLTVIPMNELTTAIFIISLALNALLAGGYIEERRKDRK